ncbi:hypothetical protein D9758_008813 [Tetrapyrgos nigripes]|uniref:TPR-like protein n=1 Tax=Tetrapyrgos nigripes TaxID=182062 RepID=A0A8H5D4H0_9AGAR|nr:hypothetical protein D9758_008813 [Tetrapyrgos nigripes]
MEPTDNGPDQTGTGNQAHLFSGAHDFNIMGSTITNIGRDAYYTYNTYLPESKPKEVTADDLLLQKPPAPDVFTGRSHLVEEAVKLLCEANHAHIAILGTGGIGKTSVALHIMENALIKKKFARRCYFIPCEILPDAANLTQGLVQAIGLQPIQGKGSYELLLDYLKSCQESLLILDNFDTPWNGEDQAQVRHFIDTICGFKLPSVIVTMRGADGPGQIQWYKLGGQAGLAPLELRAAKQAFCSFTLNGKYTIDQKDPILEQLLRQMDGIPLAIVLIAQHAKDLPLKDLLEMWNIQKTAVLKEIGRQNDRLTSVAVSIELTLNIIREQLSITGKDVLKLVAFLPNGIPNWLDNLNRMLDIFPETNMEVLLLIKSCIIYEGEHNTLKILTPIGEYIMEIFGRPEHLENHIWRFYESFMDNLAQNSTAGDQLGLHIANIFKILDIQIGKSFENSHMNVLHQLCNHSKYYSGLVPLVEKYRRWGAQMSLGDQTGLMFLHGDMLSFMGKYEKAMAIINDVEKLHKHQINQETIDLESISCSNSMSVNYTIEQTQAECFKRLAQIAYYQSDYKESQWKVQQAMDLYEKIGNMRGAAQCLQRMGDISLMLDQYEEAQIMLKQATNQFEKIGYRVGAAQCLRSLGCISQMLGQYEEAKVRLEQAKEEFEEIRSRLGVAQCLELLGDMSMRMGQYQEAKVMLEQAKKQFEEIGSRLGAAQCLRVLGEICRILGQYEEAKVMLEQAKKQFAEIRHRLGIAQCLKSLGSLSKMLTQYEEATFRLEQAKEQFEGLGSKLGAAVCLQSLGDIRQMLGQYNEARAMLDQAKKQFEEIEDRRGAAQCLRSLGDISQKLGQYEEAKIMLQQAKDQFEQLGDRQGAAQCLQGLGKIQLGIFTTLQYSSYFLISLVMLLMALVWIHDVHI